VSTSTDERVEVEVPDSLDHNHAFCDGCYPDPVWALISMGIGPKFVTAVCGVELPISQVPETDGDTHELPPNPCPKCMAANECPRCGRNCEEA
jgi:hypothetical protein